MYMKVVKFMHITIYNYESFLSKILYKEWKIMTVVI